MKKLSIAGALSAGLLMLASSFTQAAAISGQGTWETTLQGRDLDGNLATAEAYYDTVLGITWLGDANYAKTTGYDAYGSMNWTNANTWAYSLDPYGSGITDWRLPTVIDTGTPGCNFGFSGTDCGYNVDTATGEMASMYYNTLGNVAFYDTLGNHHQPGWGIRLSTGPFTNVDISGYWSPREDEFDSSRAWYFNVLFGFQYTDLRSYKNRAWAVHDGDVGASTVPVPAAVWLFNSGLLGLMAVARKRRR